MKIEWNLWINDYGGATISGESGQEPRIETRAGELTADQHAALHFVVEIARCLLLNRSITHTFNPTLTPEKQAEQEKLVRCRWSKSGKLFMIGDSLKRWKHASTVEEAMTKKCVFTCTRNVYDATPKRRAKA